jgi:hypothetical protein
MYTPDARKLSLIEMLTKVNSEEILAKIEKLLQSNKETKDKEESKSIKDFAGILSAKEANEMKDAIANTFETIDADVWN